MLFDPDRTGIALQRALRLTGRAVDDFQDLRAWRRLTATGIRFARLRARAVIVPMAISNPLYLEELKTAIRRFEPGLKHYCLVAPEAVVHARLRARGADPLRNAWEFRRASECCAAHASIEFAVQVDAATRTSAELASWLHERIGGLV